jgi:hypothetical protein
MSTEELVTLVLDHAPDGWDQFVMACPGWDCAQLRGYVELGARHGGSSRWIVVSSQGRWLAVAALVYRDGRGLLWKGPSSPAPARRLLERLLDAAASCGHVQAVLAPPWSGWVSGDTTEFATSLIETSDSRESLLARMSSSARSRVRRSIRYGVMVAEGKQYITEFWPMYRETMTTEHSPDFATLPYLIELLELPYVRLFVARVDGRVAAGSLCLASSNVLESRYVATSVDFRQVGPLNLVHAESARWAYRAGLSFLDLGGIGSAPGKQQQINRFKLGFGGGTVSYRVVNT